MSAVAVRNATVADLADLERFQRAVVDAERPFDPTLRDGAIEYYNLASLLASAEACFLIATVDEVPVGCGFARLQPAKPFLRYTTYAYLGLMYVEPPFRGRSINRLIVDQLRQWCRARGVAELRLEVYHDNADAIRAYAKSGFQNLLIEMRMSLGDGEDGRWPDGST
jgi:GNAT superfamily N-acetyltransferase